MKITDMHRRLAGIQQPQLTRVVELIKQGYGAEGIKHETGLSIRQINAVFVWQDRAWTY